MRFTPEDLPAVVDRVLIESLSPALTGAIDRLLARGVNRDGVLSYVRACAERAAAGGDPNKGKLTVAAVEAYLDRKKGGGP